MNFFHLVLSFLLTVTSAAGMADELRQIVTTDSRSPVPKYCRR